MIKKLQFSSYIKRAQNRVKPETMVKVNMFKYSICHIPLVQFWKSLYLWWRKGFWEVLLTINGQYHENSASGFLSIKSQIKYSSSVGQIQNLF
jgi:hypothetical protein